MTVSEERTELLAEVATLYYQDELNQEQIAQRLGISRSNVSRLLTEAKQNNILDIRINYPWQTLPELQDQLSSLFKLSHVRVLKNKNFEYKQMLRGLGALTARYLEGIINSVNILGISWGTTLYEVVSALHPSEKTEIKVVQMIGAVGSGDPYIDGPELARALAIKLGGQFHYLHAPLIVEDIGVRQALMNEPRIRVVLELAQLADIALLGIGSLEPSVSSLLRSGYKNLEEVGVIQNSGVVGDLCFRHFDIYGRVLNIELNHQVVGIDFESLKRIKNVIAVAGGTLKASAILGALRTRTIGTLITDEVTAQQVISLAEEFPNIS